MEQNTPFGTNISPAITPKYNEDGRWFDEDMKNLSPQKWGLFALNHYKTVSITEEQLPPGCYEITKDQQDNKMVFIRKDFKHDDLISLRGLPSQVIGEIKEFWKKEKEFNQLGFLHRRGYLFYGSHGTGKSSLIHEIVDGVIKDKGIVFYCGNPKLFNEGLSVFRQVEPNRKVVCIFEDIDAIIKANGETEILSLLDGENQISGVCNLATTNYPELLDKRIVGRPRRFDRVYRIGNLDDDARKAYLSKKLPKGSDQEKWFKATRGLSIAQISEVIISVFCLDHVLDEAVKIVVELANDKSSGKIMDMGFSSKDD